MVQLYVSDRHSHDERPVKELKGYAKVALAPGEKKTVTMKLGRKQLETYALGKGWAVEPGEFEVLIGASSRDIRLRGTFELM